jgi:hypothetical protein
MVVLLDRSWCHSFVDLCEYRTDCADHERLVKDELLILTAALLADFDLQGAKSRKKLSRHVDDSKAQDE